MTRGPSARRVGDARADRVRRRRCGDAVNTTGERYTLCHVCHRGRMCRGWGSRGHTLRGETSTTPVTHRCVRCGERDVHGVRHERAPGTSKGGRRRPSRATQAATRVTAETADCVITFTPFRLSTPSTSTYLVLKHSPHLLTTHLDHLPLRTWSTTSTQHYQHSLPSLAHLRVPIRHHP